MHLEQLFSKTSPTDLTPVTPSGSRGGLVLLIGHGNHIKSI